MREGGLTPTAVVSGEQWDAPNGWAPLQYIAISGLERYGEHTLARELAWRWSTTCFRLFKRFGSLLEKYNVENPSKTAGGGEYGTQDGFGWTNGVLLFLMNHFRIEYQHEDL